MIYCPCESSYHRSPFRLEYHLLAKHTAKPPSLALKGLVWGRPGFIYLEAHGQTCERHTFQQPSLYGRLPLGGQLPLWSSRAPREIVLNSLVNSHRCHHPYPRCTPCIEESQTSRGVWTAALPGGLSYEVGYWIQSPQLLRDGSALFSQAVGSLMKSVGGCVAQEVRRVAVAQAV